MLIEESEDVVSGTICEHSGYMPIKRGLSVSGRDEQALNHCCETSLEVNMFSSQYRWLQPVKQTI
jgi:hypothetical protein